jgi:uncharacterized protein YbjT (DUF2867 family)
MILIVGATGDLGGHVARRLLASGQRVRAMTRVPSRAGALEALGAEVVTGDVRDTGSLQAAAQGVRAVVSASHAMLGTGNASVQRVDLDGQSALIAAARHAGVEHFVFMSVLAPSLDHPLDFWRTKGMVEAKVRESGMEFTILRPSAFMGMHAFNLIGKPVLQGKRVMITGAGTNPRNFVAAEDVATLVVKALNDTSLRGEHVDIGGPENLSSMDVVGIFERVAGRTAKVTHLPIPALRVMSRVLQPVHAGVSRVLKLAIVSETTDQAFDAAPLLRRFPMTLTRVEDFARSMAASSA